MRPALAPAVRLLSADSPLVTAVLLSIAAGVCSAAGGAASVALEGVAMSRQRVALWHAALGAALLFGSVCDILPEAAAGLSAAWTGVCFGMGAAASAALGAKLRGTAGRHTERTMRAHDSHGSLRCLLLLPAARGRRPPAVLGAHAGDGQMASDSAAGLRRCWRTEGDLGLAVAGTWETGNGANGPRQRVGGGSGSAMDGAAEVMSPHRARGRIVQRGAGNVQEVSQGAGTGARNSAGAAAAEDSALDERREVLAVGLAVFFSLSAHNLLEGMSILMAAQDGMDKGVRLAAAVGFENFPEGVAIALPILYATRCPKTAVRLAFMSGMVEPAGVLLVGVFLRPWMSQFVSSSLLAVISGILASLALLQILPLAIRTSSNLRNSELNAWCAVGVMSAALLQPLCMYHARVGAVR